MSKAVILIGIVALIFGFLGGFASRWFYTEDQISIQASSLPKDVVAAKQFALVDNEGKIRATLNMTDTGDSVLKIKSKDSEAKVTLGVSFEGKPFFFISDKEGQPRIGMGQLIDESPSLTFFGKGGQGRIGISLLNEDDMPLLSLVSDRGIARAKLGLNPSGDPFLIFLDENEREIQKLP
jgi:hypothetical protein